MDGRRSHLLTLPGLVLLITGCSIFGGNNGPAPSPVEHPLMGGVPVPRGFEFVPERSVGRSTAQYRIAKCEFKGRAPVHSVVQFYKAHMPTAGFSLRQERFEDGRANLRFASEKEECFVTAWRSMGRTGLQVDIGPIPQGSLDAGTADEESAPRR